MATPIKAPPTMVKPITLELRVQYHNVDDFPVILSDIRDLCERARETGHVHFAQVTNCPSTFTLDI